MNESPPAQSSPRLSIVIPAFNESSRLPASLEKIAEYLRNRPEPLHAEILVADDGSVDPTVAGATDAARRLGLSLKVLRSPRNFGKGRAVRTGVLEAQGDWVLVTDADLSTPIAEWEKLEATGAPVAIGSRALDQSLVRQKQSLFRRFMGKLFNRLVQIARRLGYEIREVPVLWFNSTDSRVGILGGAQAYLELLRIRSRVARQIRR